MTTLQAKTLGQFLKKFQIFSDFGIFQNFQGFWYKWKAQQLKHMQTAIHEMQCFTPTSILNIVPNVYAEYK